MTREQALERALMRLLMRQGDYQHFAIECGEPRDGAYLKQARDYAQEARDALCVGKPGHGREALQAIGRIAHSTTV